MFEQIRSNKNKTAFLIILMAGLLMATGFALAESQESGAGVIGLSVALLIWFLLTLVAYFGGDSIFLALSGARKISSEDNPRLFNIVEEMKIASGLGRMPQIYVIDDSAPNAFATGRSPDKAAIAVTSGLLELLDRDELQGVIAHEIAHVKNRDILYMMMVGTMMGSIVLISDIGLRVMRGTGHRRTSNREGGQAQLVILVVAVAFMILAPLCAQLVYYAVSRKREYLADASGALFTRYPDGLARALEKISGSSVKLKSASRAMAPLYIINPMKLSATGLSDLSSTHPSTVERIKILRSMAGGASFQQYDVAFKAVTGKPKSVIGAMSLTGEAVPLRAAATDDAPHLTRHRQTTDMLWKLNKYVFIACPCQTNLKVPPEYIGQSVRCPHCSTPHLVKF